MSESSSSNSAAAPPRADFRERFIEVGERAAQRQRLAEAVAYTLGRLLAQGCTFRSVGSSVLIWTPPHLDIIAVACWLSRHKSMALQIMLAADRIEAAENKLDLQRLYFARWLVHRGRLSDQRR